MKGIFVDLRNYFSDVLDGNGDSIDEFIYAVVEKYGEDIEWEFEEGMYEMLAGIIGVRFRNPLDAVFFKIEALKVVYTNI